MKVCCSCEGHAPTSKMISHLLLNYIRNLALPDQILRVSAWVGASSFEFWQECCIVHSLRVDPRNGKYEDWTGWDITVGVLFIYLTPDSFTALQNSHPSKWELSSSSSDTSCAEKDCKSLRSWQVEIETLKTERLQSIAAIFVKKHFFHFGRNHLLHICQLSFLNFRISSRALLLLNKYELLALSFLCSI